MSLSVLTVNTGSSSVKTGVYTVSNGIATPLVQGLGERIGNTGSRLSIRHGEATTPHDGDLPDHASALRRFINWLGRERPEIEIGAIGHRIVHGGPNHSAPELIGEDLLASLRGLLPIDPEHLPHALDALAVTRDAFPGVPEVACFDTSFHRAMPRVAQVYPLPSEFAAKGVLRYGFHGLSYEYVMRELAARGAAGGRIIIAHLGNGASMAAVRDGKPIDTTMGFSPTGGLMMGTRTGDLDPGVMLYLQQIEGMPPAAINELVNKRSGLRGVSERSPDMRELLALEATDERATLAIDLFCYDARKFIGALSAALGGLDTLVFTGGIGENAAPIRDRICTGLEWMGVRIDETRNMRGEAVISPPEAPVTVRVTETDEDKMIALHTESLIRNGEGTHV